MVINGVQQSTAILPVPPKAPQTFKAEQKDFANILKGAIEQVSEAQIQSDQQTEALAMGKVDDLHHVMISAQKATITLEAAVQIQRKVIDAYNEVMRMQV